jgi:adenine/guanine phosphoribosyltransferase-like PRPP-binding protein
LKRPVKKSFSAVISNDFIAFINRSKIPVINAIVPPETPGITLAAPIPNPFRTK